MTQNAQDQDLIYMSQALEMAREAIFRTSPNPRVGCVLVGGDNQVIGVGATQSAGQAHAEVVALRDAACRGFSTQGATAYVTLEPCSHQGRTGPCCDALIHAGIKRVVASLGDPNPLVAGRGFERLAAAGVQVDIGMGAAVSRDLNLGFFSRLIRNKPWVRMKVAASLDAVTALSNGRSQWITGEQARADGHEWRARACAILTGVGTVLIDNPMLNVRGFQTERQPHLVIVDSQLRTPLDAALWGESRKVFIYGAQDVGGRAAFLEKQGAYVKLFPDAASGRVDLVAVMKDLAAKEINELHIEAGFTLDGALLESGVVDEMLIYMAPQLLGPGKGMAQLQERWSLEQAIQLEWKEVAKLGKDLRMLVRVVGADVF